MGSNYPSEPPMRTISAVLALTVLLAFSCSDNSIPTADSSRFYVIVSIQPTLDDVASGSTSYNAYAQIEDTRVSGGGDSSNAIVMVNGVQVHQFSSDLSYFYHSNIGSLSAGDAVAVTIDYSEIGYISKSLVVPPSATSFGTSPAMPGSGVANSAHSYLLSWTAGGAGIDEYSPGYTVYSGDSGSHWVKGGGVFTTGTSYTFGASYLDDGSSNAYPFIKFTLSSIAKYPLTPDGFSPGSSMRIIGVSRPRLTNTTF
jgi:hypothetical protein